jgi:hypothetical protein
MERLLCEELWLQAMPIKCSKIANPSDLSFASLRAERYDARHA